MLDVRRLRVLAEVARHGSFTAAAEALAYTPSAVSQQIAALEREAGTVLVERGARGVALTEPGRLLAAEAEQILGRLAAAELELQALAGLRAGLLRLGWFATAGATLMPRAIAEFQRRHPEVELDLFEGDPDECVPRLRARELELALIYQFELEPPVAADLERVHLLDDPLNVGCRPTTGWPAGAASASPTSPGSAGSRASAAAPPPRCCRAPAAWPASSRRWPSAPTTASPSRVWWPPASAWR
jgi:DNA-binding transcriptional LysR family regulator